MRSRLVMGFSELSDDFFLRVDVSSAGSWGSGSSTAAEPPLASQSLGISGGAG